MRYSCYANGFRFDSPLANFRFFFTFFQAYMLPLGVRVRIRVRFKVRPCLFCCQDGSSKMLGRNKINVTKR